jgi:hypothetical protein
MRTTRMNSIFQRIWAEGCPNLATSSEATHFQTIPDFVSWKIHRLYFYINLKALSPQKG